MMIDNWVAINNVWIDGKPIKPIGKSLPAIKMSPIFFESSAYNWYDNSIIDITDVNVIVPNKVVVVTFKDGEKEKMVCHKDDTFDLRKCLFIAIAKHLYKDTHTLEGIEYEAQRLMYLKKYNKMVDKALKDYKNKLKMIAKEKAMEEERKRIVANKKRKHEEYLKRRAEKRRNEMIDTIYSGVKDAMLDTRCD